MLGVPKGSRGCRHLKGLGLGSRAGGLASPILGPPSPASRPSEAAGDSHALRGHPGALTDLHRMNWVGGFFKIKEPSLLLFIIIVLPL